MQEPITPACARCGNPAAGLASIDGARYCHDGPSPTCYELEQWKPAVDWVNHLAGAFQEVADSLGMTQEAVLAMADSLTAPRHELCVDGLGWVALDPVVAQRLESRNVRGRMRLRRAE